MKFTKATKKKVKMKLQIGGASGAGKTYGAILLAKGLASSMDKIGVIDSENESASIYEHLGDYNTLNISNFDPKNYIKAIDAAIEAGLEVVIIDSVTHCWEWCQNYHSKMSGNSFQNWGTVLKMYDAFKNKMLQAPIHVITCVRKKEEMALETVDGKSQVVKKGMKSIDRSEMSFEYTIVFDIDAAHNFTVTKDRTELFVDADPTMISENTGKQILDWCNSGKTSDTELILREAMEEVRSAENTDALGVIFKKYPSLSTNEDFIASLKDKKETLTETLQK